MEGIGALLMCKHVSFSAASYTRLHGTRDSGYTPFVTKEA